MVFLIIVFHDSPGQGYLLAFSDITTLQVSLANVLLLLGSVSVIPAGPFHSLVFLA